jgi:apolipoprotein N-acyltransferase
VPRGIRGNVVAMPDDALAREPNDAAPPFWRRHGERLAAGAVFALTALLTVLAFPPFDAPECGYVLVAPAALWAYRRPGWKLFSLTVLGANAVAWIIVLGWLRHVTWGGLLLLGPFVGGWVGAWFLAVRWALPRLPGRAWPVRVLAVLALAGLWAVNEWTRTWLLGGFPWLPLAASQWQRTAVLQIAAFTGAGGVSAVLVAVGLGLAAWAHRLWFEGARGMARRSPEFLAAMFLLVVCLTVHVREAMNRAQFAVPLARVAFVQPDIPQEIKWETAKAREILAIIEDVTRAGAATRPDLILWPEASTPWALNADSFLRGELEALAREAGAPIVLGSIALETEPAGNGEARIKAVLNATFAVDPLGGTQERVYAKRKLVPFGEFVPLRPLFGWIGKFVPLGEDITRGDNAEPLRVKAGGPGGGGPLRLGALICYEDIFPALARASARAGADALVVQTNGAWFGEGAMAAQHTAHSVLRAVETRRPVLRDGNAGWSGWIDEFGAVRAVLTQDAAGKVSTVPAVGGTVYFRGAAAADVTRDSRWAGRQSFYAEHGDWFVAVCAGLAAAAFLLLRRGQPAED